jgi:hypothetical protein
MARIAATRPVTPEYPYVSADLQELISSAYANPGTNAASGAFKHYAGIIAADSDAAS